MARMGRPYDVGLASLERPIRPSQLSQALASLLPRFPSLLPNFFSASSRSPTLPPQQLHAGGGGVREAGQRGDETREAAAPGRHIR